jgi:hypothetical protein
MRRRHLWIGGLIAAVVAAAGAVLYYVTTQQRYALPQAFCSVSAGPALTPLLPEGGTITEDSEPVTAVQEQDAQGEFSQNVDCRLYVDRQPAVDVDIRASEPGGIQPEDYTTALAKLDYGEETNPPFPGRAVIGSRGALVRATCTSQLRSLVVEVDIPGQPNGPESQQRMQRWINDFIPALTDEASCTR